MFKTGSISHEQAVEESRLVSLGYNPIAKSVPDYYVNDNGDKVNLTDEQKKAFVKAYGNSNKADLVTRRRPKSSSAPTMRITIGRSPKWWELRLRAR